jgi:hypothetical protein
MQFLQPCQQEIPLAFSPPHAHFGESDFAAGVRMLRREFPGLCAREEGLRILTSPRREASLFTLAGAHQLRPFFSTTYVDVDRSLEASAIAHGAVLGQSLTALQGEVEPALRICFWVFA